MILTNEALLAFITNSYSENTSDQIRLVEFAKHEAIMDQSRLTKYIYIIKEGVAKCYRNEENDKSYIIEFLGKGEVIGEIEAILKINTICSVKAVTKMKAYRIEAEYFISKLTADPILNKMIMCEMATRIQHTSTRASFQQVNTVESSLVKLVKLLQEQSIEFTKSDIADYLGITIRTLNRSLHSSGIIVTKP